MANATHLCLRHNAGKYTKGTHERSGPPVSPNTHRKQFEAASPRTKKKMMLVANVGGCAPPPSHMHTHMHTFTLFFPSHRDELPLWCSTSNLTTFATKYTLATLLIKLSSSTTMLT
jgi:hypothetical protein